MGRHEQTQRSSLGKEALRIDRVDNSINLGLRQNATCISEDKPWIYPYRLALEWSPHDRAVPYGELGQSIAGKDASFGDIKGVHDGDDVVVASAGALDVL